MKKLEDGGKTYLTAINMRNILRVCQNSIITVLEIRFDFNAKPDASMVAGFGAWRDNHKRTVKRGERGIKIIAPSSYKTKSRLRK